MLDLEWFCFRFLCVFGLLVEGAVDLLGLLLVSALVLEDGGFSSMSVLLPVWPDLVLGPDVNHVWSDILRSQALEKIHVSPQIECFYF